MIDLHSHILYGIDDGCHTIDESLTILSAAAQNGVTHVVLTPHYIKDSIYKANNHQKYLLYKTLKQEIAHYNININIYLGNEVYIDEDLPPLLKDDIFTINGSRYILIEFPLTTKYPLIDEVIYQLRSYGLVPIIAHPERYLCYYKDYQFFTNLIKKGCFLQCNIGSLYGSYGRKSKKMIKEFLKRNMVSFFGSDIHYPCSIYNHNLEKDLLKIVKDKRIVKNILVNNAVKVLNDEEIIRRD